MRILAISHMFPTPFDPFDISVFMQVKELANLGHEVKVICPLPWTPFPLRWLRKKWRNFSSVPQKIEWDGIETYYPRYLAFPKGLFFASSGVRAYLGLKKIVSAIYRDFPFDLVHAHMALPDGYAGMLICRDYAKPLVVTFQGTDLDVTIKRNDRCLKAVQEVFQFAARVISPSPRLTRDFRRLFGTEPITIGYGVDPKEIQEADNNVRMYFRDRRIILSVSRLLKTKGIDFNLFALKRLLKRYPDLLYIIVGDGPERRYLEHLVADLKIEAYVQFTGMLPHREAMKYMALCEIFSLPSWQETFGLVYVEAMAHGKPIVGCQGQGVDGIVVHGQTGMLVKPRDVDTLVEALDFLLAHPEEARIMGERARDLVLENYTWGKIAKKIETVYEEIIG